MVNGHRSSPISAISDVPTITDVERTATSCSKQELANASSFSWMHTSYRALGQWHKLLADQAFYLHATCRDSQWCELFVDLRLQLNSDVEYTGAARRQITPDSLFSGVVPLEVLQ